MSAEPFTPEQCLEAVERFQANEAPKRIVIDTKYGAIELPLWESWYADSTNTIYLTVQIPKGYDLIRTAEVLNVREIEKF